MSSSESVRPAPWASDPPPPPSATSWGPPPLGGSAGDGATGSAAAPRDPEEAAYVRGFDEGVKEGQRLAKETLAPLQATLVQLATQLEREHLVIRRDAGQNIAALSTAVARWLFQREVAQDPKVVQDLVRRAVHLLPTTSVIEIRGHPDDLQAMSDHLEISEADGRPLPVHWIADPALEQGDFTIATPERLVDGRADVALRSLYERLASD